MRRRQLGFNILELMLVIGIVGLLTAFALPALSGFVASSRMTASANDLLIAVLAGNAEAIKRRATVTFCHSADNAADTPTCDLGDGGWEDGWVVFHDVNGDAVVDADDEIVLRHAALPGTQFVVAEAGFEKLVQFTAQGRIVNGDGALTTAHLLICDDRGNVDTGAGVSAARAVLLSRTGRATLFRDQDYIDDLTVECE